MPETLKKKKIEVASWDRFLEATGQTAARDTINLSSEVEGGASAGACGKDTDRDERRAAAMDKLRLLYLEICEFHGSVVPAALKDRKPFQKMKSEDLKKLNSVERRIIRHVQRWDMFDMSFALKAALNLPDTWMPLITRVLTKMEKGMERRRRISGNAAAW